MCLLGCMECLGLQTRRREELKDILKSGVNIVDI